MKTLYFDCFSGASGDMIVGALLDAGADFNELQRALQSLPVEGYAVSAEKVTKKGIAATQFHVNMDPGHHHPHRHLRHVLEIIEAGALPDPVKAAASETFRRIAVCEAEVHGTTVEKVHFHEVGAIDSIVDIVGAHLALHLLGVQRVYASPLPTGYGTVKAAHGVMPVPAPATAKLLQGVPSYGGDVEGELLTPTGAALIGQIAASFGPMPLMNITAVGYGSGARDHADRANVLRALLGDSRREMPVTESVVVIEANMDDMTPELYPPLIAEALKHGARDAFITPIVGKKGRPAHLLTVLCDTGRVPEVTALLFRGSTTLGVRMREETRVCLAREWRTARTTWGGVRVKFGRFAGEPMAPAPEFEDCRAVAEQAGVPVIAVYHAALAAALRGEYEDA